MSNEATSFNIPLSRQSTLIRCCPIEGTGCVRLHGQLVGTGP